MAQKRKNDKMDIIMFITINVMKYQNKKLIMAINKTIRKIYFFPQGCIPMIIIIIG